MKVLLGHVFYRSSAPSGEDAVFSNERNLLQSAGLRIVSFEKHNDELNDQRLSDKVGNAINCIWSRRSYREIKALLRKEKPDVAHFHNTFPQLSSSVYSACRELGVPVVQTLHNYRFICANGLLQRNDKPCEDCLGTSLLPALRHRCYRGSLLATSALTGNIAARRLSGNLSTGVHRYIALTEFAKSRFIAGGLPAERIRVKPNFMEDIGATPAVKSGYALYVGRLSQEKGVQTLIDAWLKLPRIPLKIVGDGPLRAFLQHKASTNNLPIEFLGQLEKAQVHQQVASARLQIVPSQCYEGFPMVVLEAFAHHTPVFASRIGSLQELIQDGVSGFSFAPSDSADIAATITRYWEDDDALRSVSATAYELFRNRYTSTPNLTALLDIYRQAIDENSRQRLQRPVVNH
jgi:glycosyltransferase involved in cell wall biosynthesis